MRLEFSRKFLATAVAAAGLGGMALPTAPSISFADEPAVPLSMPSGKEVIEKFIQATGGRDAYLNVKTRKSKGFFDIPAQAMRGEFVLLQLAPNKGYMSIDLPGLGKIEKGSDGETHWEKNPMVGVRILDGAEKEDLQRQFMFDGDLNWEKFYSSAVTLGIEKVSDRPAYKVKMTSATNGSESTFYYDVESGLLSKMESIVQVQGSAVPVVSYIGGYQDFGGLKTPTITSQEIQGMQQKITIEIVEQNKEIDPMNFELPPDVMALRDKVTMPKPK
jgi:hypothetical protein